MPLPQGWECHFLGAPRILLDRCKPEAIPGPSGGSGDDGGWGGVLEGGVLISCHLLRALPFWGGGTKLPRVCRTPPRCSRPPQARSHRRLRPLGPAGRPGFCAPFSGHRVPLTPGEAGCFPPGRLPLIRPMRALPVSSGDEALRLGSSSRALASAARHSRWSAGQRRGAGPVPPPLSHRLRRVSGPAGCFGPHPQTLGPRGGVPPASRPGRRSGCATRAAGSLFPANSLFSRVHTATPAARSVLPGAPALCAQAADTL